MKMSDPIFKSTDLQGGNKQTINIKESKQNTDYNNEFIKLLKDQEDERKTYRELVVKESDEINNKLKIRYEEQISTIKENF